MAIATAKPVADQLIATGKVRRALLGVSVREVGKDDPVRTQVQTLGQTSALRVRSVVARSAADLGGIKPNDLILSVDGQPVADAPTFAAVIAAKNGTVPLTVLRDSTTIPLSVEMKPEP
jgi:serine protease DegQ